MDCSDFSSSVYLTILNVHIGGTTRDQIHRGTKVSHENLRKSGDYKNLKLGDLILFDWGNRGETEFIPDHVGIYIGDGEFIHEHGRAQTRNQMKKDNKPSHNVTIDKLSKDWKGSYGLIYKNVIAVKRIIQDDGSINYK
ncbi:outer membrane lipoprotein [compost metagenome]